MHPDLDEAPQAVLQLVLPIQWYLMKLNCCLLHHKELSLKRSVKLQVFCVVADYEPRKILHLLSSLSTATYVLLMLCAFVFFRIGIFCRTHLEKIVDFFRAKVPTIPSFVAWR
ncbi:hypothetical protein GJ496_010064 [Pomphorhynchus laevis]|nr:hypothetical protein GJ496_010064 [Pomphorhynchus laevis]